MMRKLAKLLFIYVNFVFYNSLNFIYLTVLNTYIQFLFFKIKIKIINEIYYLVQDCVCYMSVKPQLKMY